MSLAALMREGRPCREVAQEAADALGWPYGLAASSAPRRDAELLGRLMAAAGMTMPVLALAADLRAALLRPLACRLPPPGHPGRRWAAQRLAKVNTELSRAAEARLGLRTAGGNAALDEARAQLRAWRTMRAEVRGLLDNPGWEP